MKNHFDYYFTVLSQFTYLSHVRFLTIAKKSGTEVRYKLIMIAGFFANSGALPLKERLKARQDYRLGD